MIITCKWKKIWLKQSLAMKSSIYDHPELFPKLINLFRRCSIHLSTVEQWNMIFISVLVLGKLYHCLVTDLRLCVKLYAFNFFLDVFLTCNAADLNSHLREYLNYNADWGFFYTKVACLSFKRKLMGGRSKKEDCWYGLRLSLYRQIVVELNGMLIWVLH